MSQKDLNSLLRYWRKKLGVDSSWKITAKFALTENMQECQGLNHIFPEYQSSEILIDENNTEVEETLVHELLHILFDGDLPIDIEYSVTHERAINKVAALLVQSKRKK